MTDSASPDHDSPSVATTTAMLTFEESRVLACLLEKEVTTPDYYPMTLNGLTTACNQKSNRSPVVEWDDRTVEAALDGLRRKRLAVMISMAGARVPKYKHSVGEVLDRLTPATRAVFCELMLRGRQTLGEIRTNTERMHAFPDLQRAEEAVQSLVDYPTGALVAILPPGGGRKVKTYAHLLCGPVEADAPASIVVTGSSLVPVAPDALEEVRGEITELRSRVEALEAALAALHATGSSPTALP